MIVNLDGGRVLWLSRTSLGGGLAGEEREGGGDRGDHKSGEREPGKGTGGLKESALVGRAVKERLVDVVVVSARVNPESGG